MRGVIDAPALGGVTAAHWAIGPEDGSWAAVYRGAVQAAIASTTKVMTAWTVAALSRDTDPRLDATVTVSEAAAARPGSSADLVAGETMTVGEGLRGLLIPSGNDAAIALAEHFGARLSGPPDVDPVARFVARMNREAATLGLQDTRFFDPHGQGDNLSTAHDLLRLSRKVLAPGPLRAMAGTRRHDHRRAHPERGTATVRWYNTNWALGRHGVDAGKTGWTPAARGCLVATARRGSVRLWAVTLGSRTMMSRFSDMQAVLDWGFARRG